MIRPMSTAQKIAAADAIQAAIMRGTQIMVTQNVIGREFNYTTEAVVDAIRCEDGHTVSGNVIDAETGSYGAVYAFQDAQIREMLKQVR